MTAHTQSIRTLFAILAMGIPVGLGGCWGPCDEITAVPEKDVVFSWNIPASEADCPDGYAYVNMDETGDGQSSDLGGAGIVDFGGSGIVDYGGSGIVDRGGNPIRQFCYRECTAGETPIDDRAYIDWHNKGEFIVAESKCSS